MTEEEIWKDFVMLREGEILQEGDVRSAKSDFTYREDIPESYYGRPRVADEDTQFLYYRPKNKLK